MVDSKTRYHNEVMGGKIVNKNYAKLGRYNSQEILDTYKSREK